GEDRGGGGGEQIANGLVAPAVADVLDQPDHESRVEGQPSHADDRRQDDGDPPAAGLEQAGAEPDDHPDDGRAAEQRRGVLAIDREGLADDVADAHPPGAGASGFHEADPTPPAGWRWEPLQATL